MKKALVFISIFLFIICIILLYKQNKKNNTIYTLKENIKRMNDSLQILQSKYPNNIAFSRCFARAFPEQSFVELGDTIKAHVYLCIFNDSDNMKVQCYKSHEEQINEIIIKDEDQTIKIKTNKLGLDTIWGVYTIPVKIKKGIAACDFAFQTFYNVVDKETAKLLRKKLKK